MGDTRNIVIGLLVFVIIAAFPVWYTLTVGTAGERPELEMPVFDPLSESIVPVDSLVCVEEREYMLGHHMDILDDWRDAVVRDGEKTYTSRSNGRTFEMSLTRTCLSCHANREAFCGRCHDYADVDPYCWDCHVDQEG